MAAPRRLTRRSRRHATAWPREAHRCILRPAGPCRCVRLTSNVRHQKNASRTTTSLRSRSCGRVAPEVPASKLGNAARRVRCHTRSIALCVNAAPRTTYRKRDYGRLRILRLDCYLIKESSLLACASNCWRMPMGSSRIRHIQYRRYGNTVLMHCIRHNVPMLLARTEGSPTKLNAATASEEARLRLNE